jgi:hypothetical protein
MSVVYKTVTVQACGHGSKPELSIPLGLGKVLPVHTKQNGWFIYVQCH